MVGFRRGRRRLEHRLSPKIIPVAVSGGAGTRLWPLSTEQEPKQFHALSSARSLLQDTVGRLAFAAGVDLAAPILICNSRHADLAQAQMEAVGRPPARVLLEPFGRNTAAVAMAASLATQELDPEALVLLMPSDHAIARPEAFGAAIAQAAGMARDRFVLFGIVPDRPETGYGYIEAGDALGTGLSKVARFIEKPDLETARGFLAGGRHLWNAGIFLFSPKVLIAEMERFAPEVAKATRAALAAGPRRGPVVELAADAFRACPSISIDYAVMEHTDKAAVTPLDAGWADIGSWSSLWEQGPLDEHGNLLHGQVEALDAEGCLIWSESRPVGAIGLRDIVIVETEAGVVVLPRSRSQDIKLLVERLKARNAL
jgi:mannose-1-phosphate guanylyltransferase/mannose-6-phosphate isomerase